MGNDSKNELSFDEIFELIKAKSMSDDFETKKLLEYVFLSGEFGGDLPRPDYDEMRFEFFNKFYENGKYVMQDRFIIEKVSFNTILSSMSNFNSLIVYFSTENCETDASLTLIFSFIDNIGSESFYSLNGNILKRERTLTSNQIIDCFKLSDVYKVIQQRTRLSDITTHIEYKSSDISKINGDGNFEMNTVCVSNNMEQKHTVFNGKLGRLTVATYIQSDMNTTKSGYYDFGNMRP